MNHLVKLARVALVSLLIISAQSALGASAFYTATINKLVTDTQTGLCAAWLIPGPFDEGLAECSDRWVSFDCKGDFGAKSYGQASYSMAQLALVSGRTVDISVTDTRQIVAGSTTYCLARQVQVKP